VEIIQHYIAPGALFGHPRDLKSGRDLRILEQNYRSDVASQGRFTGLVMKADLSFWFPIKTATASDAGKDYPPGLPSHEAYKRYDQQYPAVAAVYVGCR